MLLLVLQLICLQGIVAYRNAFSSRAILSQLHVSKPGDSYWNRPGPWDDPQLDTLLSANKKWSSRIKQTQPEFFEAIKEGHAPKILWIGCSDARVPANEIIGEPPGSVFVHRNIANCVINTDFNCMSVIQYAVDVLQVKHVIVCGHYDCGGVKASLEPLDHKAPLENWLRNIRDVHRLHKEEISKLPDIRSRQRRLVELNVIEQCLNIYKTAVVQRRRVQTHLEKATNPNIKFTEPRIHAFVYEPGTGELNRLPIDFKKQIQDLNDVYNMYRVPPSQNEEPLDDKLDSIPLITKTEIEELKEEIKEVEEKKPQNSSTSTVSANATPAYPTYKKNKQKFKR